MKKQDIVTALQKATLLDWKHDGSDQLNFHTHGNNFNLPANLKGRLAGDNVGLEEITLKRSGPEVKVTVKVTANLD